MIEKIRVFFRQFIGYFKTSWKLRKVIWNFGDWDYRHNLDLFVESLRITRKGIKRYNNLENNKEVIQSMGRFIRTYERSVNNFPHEYASRKMGGWKPGELHFEEILGSPNLYELKTHDDPKLSDEYYTYVRMIERITNEKLKQYLFDEKTGIYTWWD